MKKKLKVNVTAEHIQQGIRNHPNFCPVARAVSDLFPDKQVSSTLLYVHVGMEEYYALPKRATEWIRRFDARIPVEPIEFQMRKVG